MNLDEFITPTLAIGDKKLAPNRAARWLIMSAYLYYHRDSPVLSDGDYDEVSKFVADNFDELDPQLQWQLESAEAIRATGQGIKITARGESAAVTWYKDNIGGLPGGYAIGSRQWKISPEFGCAYTTIG